LIQACYQVRQIATKNSDDQPCLSIAVKSILKTDSDSAEDVFSGVKNLKKGLQLLQDYGSNLKEQDLELMKLCMQTLTISRKLLKKKDFLSKIQTGITKIKEQSEFFSTEHENVIANISSLYQQTISTMSPRIMVSGNAAFLGQSRNADKVRMYLFSAIRSAVLWQQLKGSRLQLLFQRKKTIACAEKLLLQLSY